MFAVAIAKADSYRTNIKEQDCQGDSEGAASILRAIDF
jgi:hypothetical protein